MNSSSLFFSPVLLAAVLMVSACGEPEAPETAPAPQPPPKDHRAELHALFDAEWERVLRENPETASFFGDPRYNDRWSNYSLEAIKAGHEADKLALEKLAAIDRTALPPGDQLNYDLFGRQYAEAVEGYRFRTFLIPVSPINWGGFGSVTQLVRAMPFRGAKDYEDWIARLESYGTFVDQHIALMKQGIEEKRVPPRITMQRIPDQIAAFLVDQPEKSAYFIPFSNFPGEIPAAEQERLTARGRAAIADVVLPAWKRFETFFRETYLPACRETIAATDMPDGEAYYAYRVRQMTTTDLTPEQIHETGLKEVERIRAEMEAIRKRVGFSGSLQDFFKHLRTERKFFYWNGEDLLNAYRVISKRIDPELVKLFGKIPRTPYGVKPVPEEEAPHSTTAYYYPPAEDGSRAGYFYANLYKPETRPRWEMEALTLHEAVPGHHFQIALAQELGELPEFRRLGGFTAFIEGWGLYAESLGEELGMYQDPYSKFGQLTYEMWRAIRLVVDTGIHSKGWTRQQAIDFFKDNAAKTENDIAVEVDRYISWPGQALAYKIGELRIKELRARAKQELGDKFDVRAFHDKVLGEGALPLDVLEKNIDAWIAEQNSPA